MTKKTTLEEQFTLAISTITAAVKGEGLHLEDHEVDVLRDFVKSARWLIANQETLRLAITIMNDDAVAAVKDAFPDAQITHARQI